MTDSTMPSSYDSPPTGSSGVINKEYFTSLDGLFKVSEIVLSLITFICATVNESFVKYWGGGWVQFVSITALIVTVILYAFYIFRIMGKMPESIPIRLIEFIYYAVFALFYFTCGIVASVTGYADAAIGACAFFAFASTAVFGVDTFFKLREWRGFPSLTTTSTHTVTTTTTTTSSAAYAAKEQY